MILFVRKKHMQWLFRLDFSYERSFCGEQFLGSGGVYTCAEGVVKIRLNILKFVILPIHKLTKQAAVACTLTWAIVCITLYTLNQ
jgi:hypothetical protein